VPAKKSKRAPRASRKKSTLVHGFHEIVIPCDLFAYDVVVIFGPYEKLKGYFTAVYNSEQHVPDFHAPKGIPRGLSVSHDKYPVTIWMPRMPRTAREISTLAHEAVHATYVIMEHVGIEMNGTTDEIWARTLGHIVHKVLERAGGAKS